MKRNFSPILSTEMITIYEVAIKSAAPAWWDPANYCFVYLSCCSSMVAEIWSSIYCMLVPQTPFLPYPLRYCMWIIDVKIHRACLPPKPNLWFVIAIELSNILLYRLEPKHWRNNVSCSNKIPLPCAQRALWYQPFFPQKIITTILIWKASLLRHWF